MANEALTMCCVLLNERLPNRARTQSYTHPPPLGHVACPRFRPHGNHLIAPGVFGSIQCLVCPAQHTGKCNITGVIGSNACADGKPHSLIVVRSYRLHILNTLAQPLGACESPLPVGFGKDKQKFLTPQAPNHILLAGNFNHCPGNSLITRSPVA